MVKANNYPLKPLVVGPGRGGFTMCIHILHQFIPLFPSKRGFRQIVLDSIMRDMQDYIPHAIKKAFLEHGISDDLIYNGNFQKLLGGPKWLAGDDWEKVCVRKYIGVRGMGDFTLLLTHPREVFDEDNVIHSHLQPRLWSEHPGYVGYKRFGTVRNPIGIINSSCFSLNPLASEYIQRFMPHVDEVALRENLAIYKLTDRDFFQGLIDFQKSYWDEFAEVASRYHLMRWEDLIENPVPTIRQLAEVCGLELMDIAAVDIWDRMANKNLTLAHKHNTRPGGGKVGRWKSCLVNEHLEMIRDSGLSTYLEQFGYEPITLLNESDYSPLQQQVAECLRRGEAFNPTDDDVLFGFAFNKSNVSDGKFEFRRYERREHTQLERSCFSDQALEQAVWDAAEQATSELNRLFSCVLAGDYYESADAFASLGNVETEMDGVFDGEWLPRFRDAMEKAKGRVAGYFSLQAVDVDNGRLVRCES
jgi:hypothetical protein